MCSPFWRERTLSHRAGSVGTSKYRSANSTVHFVALVGHRESSSHDKRQRGWSDGRTSLAMLRLSVKDAAISSLLLPPNCAPWPAAAAAASLLLTPFSPKVSNDSPIGGRNR